MAIRIIPHGPEWSAAVDAFNLRMREGGSHWGFYTTAVDDWLPVGLDDRVWREYHLAIDDGDQVRGAYALKPQQWWVHGKVHMVSDWQGPFSEGAIDTRFAALGLRMVRDMLKKRPALYSWGHGGNEQPVIQMLSKMGWQMHETPFCLKVLKPVRFLRLNRRLRSSPERRLGLDLLAYSGAGSVGLRVLHLGLRLADPAILRARATVVPSFGEWADALWEDCKGRYSALAVRDAAMMNRLMPAGQWPPVTRLRVESAGRTVGWAAVMDTQMNGNDNYGELRVGSVVDCLARPQSAGLVVAAATRYLKRIGVDIVVSNQAHPAWSRGFAQNGYVVLPNRRLFAASPALRDLLAPFHDTGRGLHLTNMDGHGPMAL
jgi:hypothetical protein